MVAMDASFRWHGIYGLMLIREKTMSLYQWVLALHIISMVAWMAGMLYLPRLFAYHAGVAAGSESSELFKVMEKRLLRFIINPAMIATLLCGLWLLFLNPDLLKAHYMHAKLFLVLVLFALHGFLAAARKRFEKDANTRPAKFWKVLNEVPAVIMVLIVILVVVKPF
jgi:putative membrane protein